MSSAERPAFTSSVIHGSISRRAHGLAVTHVGHQCEGAHALRPHQPSRLVQVGAAGEAVALHAWDRLGLRDVEQRHVEHDDKVSPMGVKGPGEIGIVGTAAAIANAACNATGKRLRDLPITIDKVLQAPVTA